MSNLPIVSQETEAKDHQEHAKVLSTYCMTDVEIQFLFPPQARRNRGYLNLILRCKCGYSPSVHTTKTYPPGRIFYKCGSTDPYNQCDFHIFKEQLNHNFYELCCCEQPMKLNYDKTTRGKNLVCPYWPSPEACNCCLDSRHFL